MNGRIQRFYEFGEYRIEREERLLKRGDEVVSLPPKAVELLIVLLESGGRVLTKDELMSLVWADSFVEESNLSQNIFLLRKALGGANNGSGKYIETIPRRGYRFVADVRQANREAAVAHERILTQVVFEEEIEIESEPQAETLSPVIAPRQLIAKTKWNWKARLLVGAGLILIAGASFWFFRDNRNLPALPAIQSIAVMPFLNESGNDEIDYLADGLTETLISSLSQLSSLKVKASSSVFRYKGKDVSPGKAGTELNVQTVLNGRIVRQGNELVLRVELIDTGTENQIWGKQYNRRPDTIIDLQTNVARDVLANLKAKISGSDENKIGKQYTANSEAYVLYLKGRYQLNRKTEESFRKAIEHFNEAIALDPGYALPHAGVADAYNQMGLWITLPPAESFPNAKAAALRALEIEPELAEAHASLAFEKFYYEWDFAGAEREFDTAIRLNPGYSFAHESRAVEIYETDPRRLDEALRGLRTARDLDPLSLSIGFNMAALSYFEGKNDEALAELKEMQSTDPSYTLGYGLLGAIYREKGLDDEYVNTWLKATTLEGGTFTPGEVDRLKEIYRAGGLKKYWIASAEMLQKIATRKYVSPIFIAMHYATADDKDRAIQWLEKAHAERASWLIELKVDPVWKNLHGDPRYEDLLRRVGFSK